MRYYGDGFEPSKTLAQRHVLRRREQNDFSMSDDSELLLLLGAPPKPPFPPIPSRLDVITIRETFQGLTVVTPTFGPLPWFEPAIAWMPSQADRMAVYAAKRLAGDRHVGVALSGQYATSGQAYTDIPGKDFTEDLPALVALLTEIIEEGFLFELRLAGDGQSRPNGGYNDSYGWTYGYDVMMDYLPVIVAAIRPLLPYGVLVPGYDGVFGPEGPPAMWSLAQCREWVTLARGLVGDAGYLGFQFAYPYCHWGGGRADYDDASFGMQLDVILTEYQKNLVGSTAFWEHGSRMLGPIYRKPPDEPADFDPDAPYGPTSPKFYLANDSPRGPRVFIPYEFGLYEWVRDQSSALYIAQQRAYAHYAGASVTG